MKKYKIFVIDDDKLLAEGLKQTLNESDTPFAVTIFADPVEGLQAALTAPPDLIFLDLLMPSLDGEEILRQLNKEKVPTRVIVLTAVNDIVKMVEMMKNGACNYITKPFSSQKLIMAAKRALILEGTLDINKETLV